NNSSALVSSYVSFILRKTQGMVVLGTNMRNLFRDYFTETRLFVVPNGVNLSMKSIPRNINGPARILYLSNISLAKGIEDVINAIVLMERHCRLPFHLDVVGNWRDAETRERISLFIGGKNLPLTFHGQIVGNARLRFYENADIFVFPPRQPEGHPWVIVEAMAAGLPIVTTNQGEIPQCVLNGVNGFVLATADSNKIAEKLKFLIENPKARERMGLESRRLYLENFTEEKMVERLSAAFHSVLAI
ncbi:MAG: glycosyltransferase family 4 protein, partial [Candidatus Aminicenantales bacterium]